MSMLSNAKWGFSPAMVSYYFSVTSLRLFQNKMYHIIHFSYYVALKLVFIPLPQSPNLAHRMECYTYPWDILYLSIWKNRQHLKSRGPFINILESNCTDRFLHYLWSQLVTLQCFLLVAIFWPLSQVNFAYCNGDLGADVCVSANHKMLIK